VARQDQKSGRPTSIAVALQYDPDNAAAPRVVASGRGAVAERILELAFAGDVKVRQDADLAELLTAVEIGEQIPMAAFAAVAEILFYVMRANQQAAPPGEPRS
jgi:flagellar biosynthesis protein